MENKTLTLEHFNIELKKKEIEEKECKIQNDKGKILIDKIECLRNLLEETVVDPEASATFSEGNKYKPILDEGEIEIVKDKLFELVKQL